MNGLMTTLQILQQANHSLTTKDGRQITVSLNASFPVLLRAAKNSENGHELAEIDILKDSALTCLQRLIRRKHETWR